jgi:hypothetical protein
MLRVDDPLVGQRSTVNPYRYAMYEIWNRLRWDLNPNSWSSRAKLTAYKDKYRNQKAVILCNGPSLMKSDFKLLDNVFTFGLNKINLLFESNDFRPSCIVAINYLVLEQNSLFYNQTDIPLFLDSYATRYVRTRKNTIFLHTSLQQKFAKDCSVSIYHGFTVTFTALQLAFHMGFREVALVGCDHNFAAKGMPNVAVVAVEKDANHFDSRYFSNGAKWQLPDLLQSEVSYRIARDIYELEGRRVVNATKGGKLEILQRQDLEEFVLN